MVTISDLPGSIEWLVYMGDSTALTLYLQDEDGKDLDITNLGFVGEIKTNPEDEEPAQTLSITTNMNVLTVTIPDTSILDKVSYFDIVSLEGETETVRTILRGRITAELDVTR